tara:strand:- start:208741 stop:209427 length:687 start_codon:yes stop_codon:yes gene_type:complete
MTKRNRKKEENVKDVNTFMHEVEEAMHVETMMNFWHTYKMHLVGGLIGAFVVVTGWQWYLMTSENGLARQANALWSVESLGNTSVSSYQDLLENGSNGYKILATFKTAEQHIAAGDINAANAIYDSVILGNDAQEFKQLAKFYKAIALLSTQADQAKVLLSQIVEEQSPFEMSAKEMLGIIAEQNGDLDKAKKYYENLIVNPAIPQSLRERVQSRLNFINRNNEKALS